MVNSQSEKTKFFNGIVAKEQLNHSQIGECNGIARVARLVLEWLSSAQTPSNIAFNTISPSSALVMLLVVMATIRAILGFYGAF